MNSLFSWFTCFKNNFLTGFDGNKRALSLEREFGKIEFNVDWEDENLYLGFGRYTEPDLFVLPVNLGFIFHLRDFFFENWGRIILLQSFPDFIHVLFPLGNWEIFVFLHYLPSLTEAWVPFVHINETLEVVKL